MIEQELLDKNEAEKLDFDDLGKSLGEFFSSDYVKSGKFAAITLSKLEEGRNKNISSFIETIVRDIVFGPAQEVFSGQELIDAINTKKATSFITAFSSLSEKIIEMSSIDTKEDAYSTFKDFRDVFVMSVLASIASSNHSIQKENLLKSVFSEESFSDLSTLDFHSVLVNFFYNNMTEEDSGAITIAMVFHNAFAAPGNDEYQKWTRPPQIDTLFSY